MAMLNNQRVANKIMGILGLTECSPKLDIQEKQQISWMPKVGRNDTSLLSLNDLHSSSKILAGYTSRLADLAQRLIIRWSEKHWPIRATWLWEKNKGFSQSLSAHGCSSHMFHIFSRMALSENGLAASPFHFIIMFPIIKMAIWCRPSIIFRTRCQSVSVTPCSTSSMSFPKKKESHLV